MPPASRLTNIHACPLIPAGPVIGPCVPTVLTGKLPQTVLGYLCVCLGPPDAVVRGSSNVLIGIHALLRDVVLDTMTRHEIGFAMKYFEQTETGYRKFEYLTDRMEIAQGFAHVAPEYFAEQADADSADFYDGFG